METPWRGPAPKPQSIVRLGGGRLGLRMRLESGEHMTMPLGQASLKVLLGPGGLQPPRAEP